MLLYLHLLQMAEIYAHLDCFLRSSNLEVQRIKGTPIHTTDFANSDHIHAGKLDYWDQHGASYSAFISFFLALFSISLIDSK